MGYFLDYELFQECSNCGRTTCNGNQCRKERPVYSNTPLTTPDLKSLANCVEGRQSMSERRTRIALLEENLSKVVALIDGIEGTGDMSDREQIDLLNLERLHYLEQLNAAYMSELKDARKFAVACVPFLEIARTFVEREYAEWASREQAAKIQDLIWHAEQMK